MARLILLNKPYDVLSQFTDDAQRKTLADYIPIKNVYPAGRLDRDSEGLLLLTDHSILQHTLSHPDYKAEKTYWVQVEGEITQEALQQLADGIQLKDGLTRPATAKKITEPNDLWPRNPPIRQRKNSPTSWLSLSIHEGKNRQVRRMTAAVGFPTLRLIRASIGQFTVDSIALGSYQEMHLNDTELKALGVKNPNKSDAQKSNKKPRTRYQQRSKTTTNQRPKQKKRAK